MDATTSLCDWLATLARPSTPSFYENITIKSIIDAQRTHDYPTRAHYPTREEALQMLHHGRDPFARRAVKPSDVSWITYTSSATRGAAAIEEQLSAVRPLRFAIEVGSFVGSSAVKTWGPLMRRRGGLLLTIDTWQGSASMRLGRTQRKYMPLEDEGSPKTYRLFLDRIQAHGLNETVVPLPMASLTAARAVELLSWRVDLIYVDSAHEAGETLLELAKYWRLLRPGGVMLGDDLSWPAVRDDVLTFANCLGTAPDLLSANNIWMLRKPPNHRSRRSPDEQ